MSEAIPNGWVWSDHCGGLRHVATQRVVKVEDGLLCSDGPRSIPVDVAAYLLRRHEQDEREVGADADYDRIMALTEDELRVELADWGFDLDEIDERVRELIARILAERDIHVA